ncbi:spermidine Synthase [Oratosquilla oratoria]|uniref:spermidine Synthase n=1 Tax=Oratosquilla oratoria TaxID=337810 RepID=UPI003F76DA57
MDQHLKGWFTERLPVCPGEAFSMQVKEILLEKKSEYQDIKIFESTHFGRVLVLDGAIQCTERDEASYQEMITFLPLNAHPCPKKVLIVGGGDGGVAREVAKHPQVESIVQCEIDKEVIEACKKYIPSMGCGFDNPKHRLYIDEGTKFIECTKEKFDVIITDSSDPVVPEDDSEEGKKGPADTLYNADTYLKMKEKLEEGGILCFQGENMWQNQTLIAGMIKSSSQIFPVTKYAYTCTPTYPGGQIGFLLCSTNKDAKLEEPVTVWDDDTAISMGLKYYNADIHRASFVLPSFMKKFLREL